MTLHAALREATHAAHGRLEEVMGLEGADLDTARYGRALQVLQAARAGWAPGLRRWFPDTDDAAAGRLLADLRVLRLATLAPMRVAALDHDAAWGVRYVQEGSALGGRVLLRRLEPLGFTAAAGASYFAGDGAATGARWKAFLAELEREGDRRGIIDGAVQAFEDLIDLASDALPQLASTNALMRGRMSLRHLRPLKMP